MIEPTKTRRKKKRKGKRKPKASATPKIKNMDPAVLDAVKKSKELEFIEKEIEQNRQAAHRRMEQHMSRINRTIR